MKDRSPRTNLISSLIINIGCFLLLYYGYDMGLQEQVLMMMGLITLLCTWKNISAVWKFKKLTGQWPDLKYDSLLKP